MKRTIKYEKKVLKFFSFDLNSDQESILCEVDRGKRLLLNFEQNRYNVAEGKVNAN